MIVISETTVSPLSGMVSMGNCQRQRAVGIMERCRKRAHYRIHWVNDDKSYKPRPGYYCREHTWELGERINRERDNA